MLTAAEKWRFVKEPLVQSSLLSRGVGGLIIAYCICWLGIASAMAIIEPTNLKPIVGTLAMVGFFMLLGVLLVRRPVQYWTGHQRLQQRGAPATGKILSKATDRWKSGWGDWEELVVVVEVTSDRDSFQLRSPVDADTYARAEVGRTFPIVIDYDRRRWAWQRETSSV